MKMYEKGTVKILDVHIIDLLFTGHQTTLAKESFFLCFNFSLIRVIPCRKILIY